MAIHGGWEEIVFPQRNAKIDFGENVAIPYVTHVSIILDPRTFWEIWSWLTYDVFGEPGPLERQGISTKIETV